MTAPTQDHETRRAMLATLADLAGFTLDLPLPLPDGSVPDVAKVSPQGNVFVADAKDTESPQRRATQAQLSRYLRWVRAAATATTGSSVLAICYKAEGSPSAWQRLLISLTEDLGLDEGNVQTSQLDKGTDVVWITVPGRVVPRQNLVHPLHCAIELH